MRLTYIIRLSILLMAATPLTSRAQDDSPPGQILFNTKSCNACHGKDGKKAILAFPNLAGNDKTYLLTQVHEIRDGQRVGSNDDTGNPRTAGMKAVVHLLSEEELGQVTDWLSSSPAAKPIALDPPPSVEMLAKGKELFASKGCIACHGEAGKKPLMPGYPFLASQKKEYLMNQVNDIKSGARSNGLTMVMKPITEALTAEEIDQITTYLSQEPR